MSNSAVEFRDQLSNSAFVQMLREKNKELFNRLVDRFAKLKQVSRHTPTSKGDRDFSDTDAYDNNGLNTTDAQVFGVEDAILFFLNAKHKRDVLYFKQKNAGGVKSSETAKFSLGLSSAPVSGGRYLPYDLERTEGLPHSGAGDFFMMTSASLVHYSNNNDNNISGEVIPLSQWIMESKMFSLLLAGIPLFQKFLVRKVFLGWVRVIRQAIYRDNRKRIAQSLPFARQAFARPMLQSCRVLHDIQEIRSLTLPSDRPALGLIEVQEHQKELLTAAETRLIDAKEELLGLMEKMVQGISDDLTPPTNMDELYSAEATSIHEINAKWKSTPIAAIRHRKTGIQRQKATAALDMSLVEAFIRMMAYMFTESLYLMIIGCVQHLRSELYAEDNLGAICAAVTIAGDSLELSPSLEQTKHMFLDGLAKLIRLVSNFHFTKNAITWSNNRGTGVLTVVAESFASSDTFSTKFDLQSVLRVDPVFDEVTKDLSNRAETTTHRVEKGNKLYRIRSWISFA
ncbi:hypothetical protein BBO99_00000283 [Phytophthora kernoviae]|uniref:Uncharacterized protein n=2 Tax=Phytophthora kernoviae TaxID=325452 RepID=A0A3R7K5R0_9STRA|nr:hypothetical protein G195_008615 [Phytophthora kernoviae 00238/432]KAG2527452.1 hypothetical protein JM18_003782 [Phytophthora kernoviae]KAG2528806.1 hypothetical protein JM16_002440 [Phytophthora kernoviae]RLN21351.1 hypothetical protein BBI17_000307 [Phytophthora kernoviae]RLN85714.1 hypothetical protein BBO99_00000283 [Phytophthora kernoviae]